MGEFLDFDDVQILRLESAAIRGHTGKLSVVGPDATGRPMEIEALRERIASRLDDIPRLRQRVAMAGDSRPRWVEDPEFEIENHVVAIEGGSPVDDAGLRRHVSRLMGERLDHERPLWRLELIPMEDGRTAIFGRIHHCMADGVSSMRILAGVLWDEGEAQGGVGTGQGAPERQKQRRMQEAGRGRLAKIARTPAALRRELRIGKDSPLDKHIGPSREVAWTSVPLAVLKRIEHAAGEGVTVNDVILAAVSGALRTWLEEAALRPVNLKAQVPVSLHSREEGSGEVGNRDSFLFVDLPITEPDPVKRLRLISAETRERKLDHDAETLYSFFHSLSHFGPLYREVTRLSSGPREFALSVSNVPGPRDPVTLLGRPLSAFSSFAEPADRHALRVAVVSLGGAVTFGLCSDPEAVGSLERIAASLERSIAELSAIH